MIIVDFNSFRKKVYSQFGQDGVLEKIFNVIGTTNKFFVEFGSSGSDESQGNTANLRRRGFDGLLMDGSATPYSTDRFHEYPVEVEFVSVENIVGLFEKHEVPVDLDFLSIDIDGNDYWVLKEILSKQYKPRVVCIEANYHLPMSKKLVWPYDPEFIWQGNTSFGASYAAFLSLCIEFEYSLASICGCDMIFIRNECLPDGAVIKDANNIVALYEVGTLDRQSLEAGLLSAMARDEWIDLDDTDDIQPGEEPNGC